MSSFANKQATDLVPAFAGMSGAIAQTRTLLEES
jgi:hypothetical protein